MPDGGDTLPGEHSTAGSNPMVLILYRLTQIERKLDESLKDHDMRLRKLEDSVLRISERLTAWQLVQGIFTAVASSIAGWLGMRNS